MPDLELSFESGEDSLSVRRFSTVESVSSLFTVSVWAVSPNPSLALADLVGKGASLRVTAGWKHVRGGGTRLWTGICASIEQVRVDPKGLSTYHLAIVPTLWLLTQKRDYRIFQYLSVPDVIDKVLGEWGIAPEWQIDRPRYERLEYLVQYGESDLSFFCRLLEDAGIAFRFVDDPARGSVLTLGDRLQGAPPRPGPPVRYVDNPGQSAEQEFITEVVVGHDVRPGAYTLRGQDLRRPDQHPSGAAPKAPAPEDRYEQYHYDPGAQLIEMRGKSREHPHADDRGVARYDPPWAESQASRALEALRADRRAVGFAVNTLDLWPGVVFSIGNHPRGELAAPLLVIELACSGSPGEEWSARGRAVFTDVQYRPAQITPKPRAVSVQSATVVGPAGQEIHTDEFGRVRVELRWDRLGHRNESSSCWMRVSQGWAGAGYGLFQVPRVGQEVLVGFMDDDVDQPVVVGRVHNLTSPVPYRLPEDKTRAGWKSDTSPGSHGYNEVYFEDQAGDELVYLQAQRHQRTLVKHDETITVGRDRDKTVVFNETDTTLGNRTEVTVLNRTETIGMHRTTMVVSSLEKRVVGDETETNEVDQVFRVGKDHESVTRGEKRELIDIDQHVTVRKNRNERVDKTFALSIGIDLQEKIGGSHATQAGADILLQAGSVLVGEARDITLKGPGGFLRIDASGGVVSGTLVKINTGGSGGGGSADVQRALLARQAGAAKPHKWDKDCLLKIFCPGDKAVIDQLAKTKLDVADEITFDDPYYNGTRWTTKVFPAGGVSDGSEKKIGLLSGSSCEEAATTIYHEIHHQNQDPKMTFAEKEYDAYTVTEQWTINKGFGSQGSPSEMRATTADGKVVPNTTGIQKFVHDNYPIPKAGASETVVGKAPNGDAIISDGTKTWKRKPQRGDTYPGPMKVKGHKDIDTSEWKC
ncbi:MAG: type VI secretion system tip protein TssI/VgrG [Byssovorax sp.]